MAKIMVWGANKMVIYIFLNIVDKLSGVSTKPQRMHKQDVNS